MILSCPLWSTHLTLGEVLTPTRSPKQSLIKSPNLVSKLDSPCLSCSVGSFPSEDVVSLFFRNICLCSPAISLTILAKPLHQFHMLIYTSKSASVSPSMFFSPLISYTFQFPLAWLHKTTTFARLWLLMYLLSFLMIVNLGTLLFYHLWPGPS